MSIGSSRLWDTVRLLRHGGPGLCNVAVTNSCNATCDFCNFARGKVPASNLRWIDPGKFAAALDILYARNIRYVSFFGGEPLLHPHLADMIGMAVAKNMGPAVITNGWLLPQLVDRLADAGLKTVYISIDAGTTSAHEANRGLEGVCRRIRAATSRMPELGMTPIAQVTMSKSIDDYRTLVPLLGDLGLAAVVFSYRKTSGSDHSPLPGPRIPGSSTSPRMNSRQPSTILTTCSEPSPSTNPRASVTDLKRHLYGEPEKFVCYGGFKSF